MENIEQKAPVNIETKIADWLNYFSYDLERESSQLYLFNAITTIIDDYENKEEGQTIKGFLESTLKLTFILKDNKKEIDNFIKYHRHNASRL